MKKPDDVEIIVVATLLEKVPNFANLCRTCEIFGVKELVLPSLKLIDEEGFKNISVTSEKWLPLSEVREKDLGEYLKLKKLEGYTVNSFLRIKSNEFFAFSCWRLSKRARVRHYKTIDSQANSYCSWAMKEKAFQRSLSR